MKLYIVTEQFLFLNVNCLSYIRYIIPKWKFLPKGKFRME